MGRTSDEEGETSTKVCKSDEIDDRPLKKARYVWQIKGKYHLKKPDDDKVSCFATKSTIKDECSSVILPCKHSGFNSENNCDNEVSTMEVSENSSPFQDSNVTSENEINPERHNALGIVNESKESHIKTLKQEAESFTATRPEGLSSWNAMFPNTRPSTSWQLRKWQARQVARCFVDNTINRVLEDMGFVPLPVDADDILDEFPMTESENDEGLEDEAVLMAIHRHGLRTDGEINEPGPDNNKTSNDTVKINSTEDQGGREHHNTVNVPCVCSITPRQDSNAFVNLDPFHHRPVFWDQGELDSQKLLHSSFTNELNGNEIVHRWFSDGLFSSVINSESSSDSDIKSCDESMADEQSVATETACENDRIQKENIINVDKSEEPKSQEKQDANSPSFEHSDFLDKAVAVAIQKKGLSKLSCADYG